MRTKTLLLLAVGCGVAILVAGVAFLLMLAANDDEPTFVAVGQPARVGDVEVTVTDYAEAEGRATVSVRIGGVDDPDGAAAFRLAIPGERLAATGTGEDACGPITVADRACSLSFALDDAPGGVRILTYGRGDEVARWELVA